MCGAEGGLCARYFGAKKKGKELILLEACVVEMSLEEKQGSPPCCWVRGIIQAHVAGEKPSAPQDLCLGAVATGGLRFHRHGVCAGEWVVLYSQGLKFALCTHPVKPRDALSRAGGCEEDEWTWLMPAMHQRRLKLSLPAPSMSPWGIPAHRSFISSCRTSSNFYPGGKKSLEITLYHSEGPDTTLNHHITNLLSQL